MLFLFFGQKSYKNFLNSKIQMTESFETREKNQNLLLFSVTEIKNLESAAAKISNARIENELSKMNQLISGKRKSILKTVEKAGFSCKGCGKCCEREDDDNSVYILSEEIEKIETAGFSRNQFILPLLPDFYETAQNEQLTPLSMSFVNTLRSLAEQTDESGRIHTFGWMLQRKTDGSCIFLNDGSKKCRIYEIRPALCRTYPFFADENGVSKCVCDGLGSVEKTDSDLTKELTEALLNRILSDHMDYTRSSAIIHEYYNRFAFNTEDGRIHFEENLKNGFVLFVVYDSTGIYTVEIQLKRNE